MHGPTTARLSDVTVAFISSARAQQELTETRHYTSPRFEFGKII